MSGHYSKWLRYINEEIIIFPLVIYIDTYMPIITIDEESKAQQEEVTCSRSCNRGMIGT